MRRWSLLLVLSLILLVASCASSPPHTSQPAAAPPAPTAAQPLPPDTLKPELWPKIFDDETYLTVFPSSWSEDESIGTIRNLQNSMVEFNADLPFSALSIDLYGLRATWTWTDNTSTPKSANLIIPFDQVSSILLENYPKLNKNFKWGILVGLTTGTQISIRTPTRDAAERLGKAILALAGARGSKVSLPDTRFGAALGPLNEAQAKAAGIPQSSGVIISWVFRESPAEKAGISPQDILTSVGGNAIQKTDDLFSAIAAASGSGAKELRIAGLRRSYKVENNKYVEIFVPVFFTLEIAQTGASQ